MRIALRRTPHLDGAHAVDLSVERCDALQRHLVTDAVEWSLYGKM